MSGPAFTPGPWALGPWVDSVGGHVYRVVTHQGRKLSAVSVYGRKEDGTVGGRPLKFGGHTKTISDSEAEANARLIAAAPDHADICWAMCVAGGRWEPWGDGRGEFCINGMCYATEFDEFSVPIVTPALRAQIAKARGDTATCSSVPRTECARSFPSPSSHSQRCGGGAAGGLEHHAGGASISERTHV